MVPIPFRQKPSFRALVLGILLTGTYLYIFVWGDGIRASLPGIIFDLILLFVFFQASLFFYAQFVLPVRGLDARRELQRHLFLHARNAHGAAIHVRNGRKVERSGESERAGPGLLWVDMASAAVIRSAAGPKYAVGPGVHFINQDERIATTFSLHVQTCTIGPDQGTPIFDRLQETASEEERREYAELQAKRLAVSARTRDGNEVVPEIRVDFKLDARPAGPGMAGSRFGYVKEAVEAAARAEGMRPASDGTEPQYVAWNQLPGLIAVDLWREYLGKFTLDELFSPRFPALPDLLQPEEPARASSVPPVPFVVRRNLPAQLLRRLNNSIESRLNAGGIQEESETAGQFFQRPVTLQRRGATQANTALQTIGQMVRARMMQAVVPILDDCGRLAKGHLESEEYRRLRERGLVVLSVSIEGLRFDPAVEAQIVQQWNTAWLANAGNDRRHVEQLELLAAQAGRQKALLEHAGRLAQALNTEEPSTIAAAVKTALLSTQNEILTDERIYGRAGRELDVLSQLLKWVEAGGHE